MVGCESIVEEYKNYIANKDFSCIAAKAALGREQIHTLVLPHIACPAHDKAILDFLYSFVDTYRNSEELYHSATVIFEQPQQINEAQFEEFFWQRLQLISDMDANLHDYDKRVTVDPSSPDFSFSIKEEAFFVIGLHPGSSRQTRRFTYPAIVFNPHAQFEKLRESSKYDNLKYAVRKKEVAIAGSINPMLHDFGEASEVYQYSGRQYNNDWKCPLNIKHER
jgi:FPC/CPF motif-containing protein YcgG